MNKNTYLHRPTYWIYAFILCICAIGMFVLRSTPLTRHNHRDLLRWQTFTAELARASQCVPKVLKATTSIIIIIRIFDHRIWALWCSKWYRYIHNWSSSTSVSTYKYIVEHNDNDYAEKWLISFIWNEDSVTMSSQHRHPHPHNVSYIDPAIIGRWKNMTIEHHH